MRDINKDISMTTKEQTNDKTIKKHNNTTTPKQWQRENKPIAKPLQQINTKPTQWQHKNKPREHKNTKQSKTTSMTT